MHRNLADIQDVFAGAMADRPQIAPAGLWGHEGMLDARRIAVHRNNIVVSLTEVLASHFPVTCRIVGNEFFVCVAQEFVARYKPTSPLLMNYGEELPAFIEGFKPADDVPYLADVARLEFAWIRAYHAAEQTPLGVEVLKRVSSGDLLAARIVFHPSLQLIRSAYPVATIWAAHQPGSEPVELGEYEAEGVLVLRPAADVLVSRLPAGTAAFLSAIKGDEPIGRAGQSALVDSPEFDLGKTLVDLFAAGAVVEIHASEREPTKGLVP